MMGRASYDLVRVGLRLAVQLWPLWVVWWSWDLAYTLWERFLLTFPSARPGAYQTFDYRIAWSGWNTAALLGPLLVMIIGLVLHRARVGSRAMALAGIFGLAGTALLMLYQSLGQLVGQWGREGKQAWFDSTAWQLFAAVQDWDTARELSAICGEYGVVSTSTGDTEGNQSRGAVGTSSSSGRSENRSEVKRALIKPDELRNDTRTDEAFVLVGGSKPLRCGRAIWFRRSEWADLVDANRFHGGGNDNGNHDRNAAD